MPKEPTLMQLRYAKELENPKNKTRRQAATAAGFGPRTDIAKIDQRLSETTLVDALVVRGNTPEAMADRISDGQDALKMQVDSQGNEHFSPDWNARFRYDTLVLRMFGVRTSGQSPSAEQPAVQINTFNKVYQLMGASLASQRDIQAADVVEMTDD